MYEDIAVQQFMTIREQKLVYCATDEPTIVHAFGLKMVNWKTAKL